MAKAIYGNSGTDVRLAAEVVRLRARVRELEGTIAVLQDRLDAALAPSVGAWDPDEWVVRDEVLVPDPR